MRRLCALTKREYQSLGLERQHKVCEDLEGSDSSAGFSIDGSEGYLDGIIKIYLAIYQ